MFKKHHRERITLRRDLGLFETTLAGVGIIVGAGIYVLIGAASSNAGNMVWLSFVIAAFLAFLTGLSYAELSSIYSDDSGEYSYVEHTLNRRAGFVVGFMVILSLIIGTAAVAIGFGNYMFQLIGISNVATIAVTTIIVFSVINFIGIKQSMKLNIILTLFSIGGLILIIFVGLPKFGSVDYFEMASNFSGVFKASSLIFFAYMGFESVVKLSEETVNPRHIIPLALILSIGISTVLYILVAVAAVSVNGWQSLANSPAPLAQIASLALGSKAGILLSIIAVMSTGNTVLLELIAVSRMIYSMAWDYAHLHFLSKINKRTNTPHIAIIISGLLSIAFVFLGNIETVVEMANFAVFTVFALINIALIKSRYQKHRHELFHEPLNIGKFPLLALFGLIICILMIFSLEPLIIMSGFAMIVCGVLLYNVLEKGNLKSFRDY